MESAPVQPDLPITECEVGLLLTSNEAELVETFRQEIRLCGTDTEKFDKCIQKRDELLEEDDRFILRLAAFENVMSTECTSYRGRKERACLSATRSGTADTAREDGTAKWNRFVGAAAVGFGTMSKLLPPLRMISLHWGKDVVQHYQLAGRGQSYCNNFSAAVKLHPREDGIRRLNQLLLRRFRIPGRRNIRAGVNPVEPVDLQNLVAWRAEAPFSKKGDPDGVQLPFADLTSEDLPPGFTFDRFGLMVRHPSAPLVGADLANSDTVAERIVSTTATEEEAGKLSTTADNQNVGTAGPLNDLALASPRQPRLSSPLSSPPGSPLAGILFRSSTPEITDITAPDDSDADINPVLVNTSSSKQTPHSQERLADGDHQPNTNATAAAARLRPRKENPDYHEAPQRNPKPVIRRTRPLNTKKLPEEQCCPPQIPPLLLNALDESDFYTIRRLLIFASPEVRFQDMCHSHLAKFVEAATNLESFRQPPEANQEFQMVSHDEGSPPRRRRTSLPDISNHSPLKRPRLDDLAPAYSALPTDLKQKCRLKHDPIRDEAYRQRVLGNLQSAHHGPNSWGQRTSDLISQILQVSRLPRADEAYFLSGGEASELVELGQLYVPIFTQGQQPFQWRGKDRPILQFFSRVEDLGLDRTVSVQIPSRTLQERSCERKTLSSIRGRFLMQRSTSNPWNLLDLQSPVPSALPSFLEGENCQLLLQIRDAVLMGSSAERTASSTQDWNTWRNVIDWALMSEGGHNTAPHMDSHGYSTWITIQEGRVGFGWMSRPNRQEEEAWMSDPHNFIGGDWRYAVLSPGQTVFFPSGTIHFVFRAHGEQTFALGGHILQWSSVDRWLEVVIAQMKHPEITNEDMETTALKHIHVVKGLLENRIRAGRKEKAGCQDAIARFFSLLRGFNAILKER